MVVMGDVGQTYNSSMTAQFVSRYVKTRGADFIVHVGDVSYGYASYLYVRTGASCLRAREIMSRKHFF